MPSLPARHPSLRPILRAAPLLVLCACGTRAGASASDGTSVLDALLGERFTAGRLSEATAWSPCSVTDSSAIIPRLSCGEGREAAAREVGRLRPDAHTTGLRATALLDLLWRETTPAGVDRAVESFERERRRAPDDAAVLNQLAVAYLELGERDQRLAPMLQALDAVSHAAARDPASPAILFNRALVLERLYLVGGARAAWSRYLAVERDPRWRAEAEAHLRRMSRAADTVSWTDLIAKPPPSLDTLARVEIATRVRRSPQAAREASVDVLAAWGHAEVQGDRDRAARFLGVARVIAREMDALGADRGVALAVRAIDAAERLPSRTRTLAEGHVLLGDGIRDFKRDSLDAAIRSLLRAERSLSAAGSPAARWATFYRGAAEVNRVHYARGDSLLRRVLDEAGRGEPALVGKAWWALGLSQLRRGNYDTAVDLYRTAAPFITRSREVENAGAVSLLVAEALTLSGQTPTGEAEAYRAIRLLSSFRGSNFLNNHLAIIAEYARARGLRYAALEVTDEMVTVARAVDKPNVIALALCTRARDRAATGLRGAARADVDAAERWARSITRGRSGDRMRANVTLACGRLARLDDPRAALPRLADAVETYRGFERDLYLPTALYEAAQAAIVSGDTARARPWLREAAEHIEGQQATFTKIEMRATFYETVENVFDAMIALELAGGRPAAAFEALERSRTAVWPGGAPRARSAAARPPLPSLRTVGASLPADMLLVEYALLGDQLVVWTASRRGWREHRVAVRRDSVAALVERFAREASAPAAGGADAGSRLYDLLLRPIEAELRGVRRLTVVPDRELGRLPFAALRDRAAGRYVVEDFELRTVPSAAFYLAAASRSHPARPGGAALVVGDPALDSASARDLPDLPASAREARAVAAYYGHAKTLTGAAAARDTVLRLLPQSSIFHFAGHAVLNGEQPELSYLALAADGPRGSGILHARDIGGLRLSNMQVVVLSACSSLTPRATRTGAVAGLAYSFLRAGSPATVSTLWDVDDAATEALLVHFHRRLAAGTPAPAALRQAQLDALSSTRAEERAPRTWAAFIYTGP